jgi:hypothetical protein
MAINRVVFANREQEAATWHDIRNLLNNLKRGHGDALFLEDSGGFEMNVAYVPGFGFYVSTLSVTDRERIASDRSLPSDRVRIEIAEKQEVPRSVLISDDLADRIVREFLETGSRCSAADWLDPFEIIK